MTAITMSQRASERAREQRGECKMQNKINSTKSLHVYPVCPSVAVAVAIFVSVSVALHLQGRQTKGVRRLGGRVADRVPLRARHLICTAS